MACVRSGFIVGILLSAAASVPCNAEAGEKPTDGNYLLVLDGAPAAQLKSFEGGAAAEVIREAPGADLIAKKRLGRFACEPASLQLSVAPDKAAAEWITATWRGKIQQKSGHVSCLDNEGIERQRWEFKDALLAETTFPALDASSKDAGYLTLKLQPVFARFVAGSGKPVKFKSVVGPAHRLTSNFRLEIAGLDCKRVNRIDSFTVRLQMRVAEKGEPRLTPLHLEFPDFKVTLADGAPHTWIAWHDDSMIRANQGRNNEKSGSLVLLSANLSQEVARIDLQNLGIFRLAHPRVQGGADSVQRLTAEMYCQRIEFSQ
jgi:hypothetical protein